MAVNTKIDSVFSIYFLDFDFRRHLSTGETMTSLIPQESSNSPVQVFIRVAELESSGLIVDAMTMLKKFMDSLEQGHSLAAADYSESDEEKVNILRDMEVLLSQHCLLTRLGMVDHDVTLFHWLQLSDVQRAQSMVEKIVNTVLHGSTNTEVENVLDVASKILLMLPVEDFREQLLSHFQDELKELGFEFQNQDSQEHGEDSENEEEFEDLFLQTLEDGLLKALTTDTVRHLPSVTRLLEILFQRVHDNGNSVWSSEGVYDLFLAVVSVSDNLLLSESLIHRATQLQQLPTDQQLLTLVTCLQFTKFIQSHTSLPPFSVLFPELAVFLNPLQGYARSVQVKRAYYVLDVKKTQRRVWASWWCASLETVQDLSVEMIALIMITFMDKELSALVFQTSPPKKKSVIPTGAAAGFFTSLTELCDYLFSSCCGKDERKWSRAWTYLCDALVLWLLRSKQCEHLVTIAHMWLDSGRSPDNSSDVLFRGVVQFLKSIGLDSLHEKCRQELFVASVTSALSVGLIDSSIVDYSEKELSEYKELVFLCQSLQSASVECATHQVDALVKFHMQCREKGIPVTGAVNKAQAILLGTGDECLEDSDVEMLTQLLFRSQVSEDDSSEDSPTVPTAEPFSEFDALLVLLPPNNQLKVTSVVDLRQQLLHKLAAMVLRRQLRSGAVGVLVAAMTHESQTVDSDEESSCHYRHEVQHVLRQLMKHHSQTTSSHKLAGDAALDSNDWVDVGIDEGLIPYRPSPDSVPSDTAPLLVADLMSFSSGVSSSVHFDAAIAGAFMPYHVVGEMLATDGHQLNSSYSQPSSASTAKSTQPNVEVDEGVVTKLVQQGYSEQGAQRAVYHAALQLQKVRKLGKAVAPTPAELLRAALAYALERSKDPQFDHPFVIPGALLHASAQDNANEQLRAMLSRSLSNCMASLQEQPPSHVKKQSFSSPVAAPIEAVHHGDDHDDHNNDRGFVDAHDDTVGGDAIPALEQVSVSKSPGGRTLSFGDSEIGSSDNLASASVPSTDGSIRETPHSASTRRDQSVHSSEYASPMRPREDSWDDFDVDSEDREEEPVTPLQTTTPASKAQTPTPAASATPAASTPAAPSPVLHDVKDRFVRWWQELQDDVSVQDYLQESGVQADEDGDAQDSDEDDDECTTRLCQRGFARLAASLLVDVLDTTQFSKVVDVIVSSSTHPRHDCAAYLLRKVVFGENSATVSFIHLLGFHPSLLSGLLDAEPDTVRAGSPCLTASDVKWWWYLLRLDALLGSDDTADAVSAGTVRALVAGLMEVLLPNNNITRVVRYLHDKYEATSSASIKALRLIKESLSIACEKHDADCLTAVLAVADGASFVDAAVVLDNVSRSLAEDLTLIGRLDRLIATFKQEHAHESASSEFDLKTIIRSKCLIPARYLYASAPEYTSACIVQQGTSAMLYEEVSAGLEAILPWLRVENLGMWQVAYNKLYAGLVDPSLLMLLIVLSSVHQFVLRHPSSCEDAESLDFIALTQQLGGLLTQQKLSWYHTAAGLFLISGVPRSVLINLWTSLVSSASTVAVSDVNIARDLLKLLPASLMSFFVPNLAPIAISSPHTNKSPKSPAKPMFQDDPSLSLPLRVALLQSCGRVLSTLTSTGSAASASSKSSSSAALFAVPVFSRETALQVVLPTTQRYLDVLQLLSSPLDQLLCQRLQTQLGDHEAVLETVSVLLFDHGLAEDGFALTTLHRFVQMHQVLVAAPQAPPAAASTASATSSASSSAKHKGASSAPATATSHDDWDSWGEDDLDLAPADASRDDDPTEPANSSDDALAFSLALYQAQLRSFQEQTLLPEVLEARPASGDEQWTETQSGLWARLLHTGKHLFGGGSRDSLRCEALQAVVKQALHSVLLLWQLLRQDAASLRRIIAQQHFLLDIVETALNSLSLTASSVSLTSPGVSGSSEMVFASWRLLHVHQVYLQLLAPLRDYVSNSSGSNSASSTVSFRIVLPSCVHIHSDAQSMIRSSDDADLPFSVAFSDRAAELVLGMIRVAEGVQQQLAASAGDSSSAVSSDAFEVIVSWLRDLITSLLRRVRAAYDRDDYIHWATQLRRHVFLCQALPQSASAASMASDFPPSAQSIMLGAGALSTLSLAALETVLVPLMQLRGATADERVRVWLCDAPLWLLVSALSISSTGGAQLVVEAVQQWKSQSRNLAELVSTSNTGSSTSSAEWSHDEMVSLLRRLGDVESADTLSARTAVALFAWGQLSVSHLTTQCPHYLAALLQHHAPLVQAVTAASSLEGQQSRSRVEFALLCSALWQARLVVPALQLSWRAEHLPIAAFSVPAAAQRWQRVMQHLLSTEDAHAQGHHHKKQHFPQQTANALGSHAAALRHVLREMADSLAQLLRSS